MLHRINNIKHIKDFLVESHYLVDPIEDEEVDISVIADENSGQPYVNILNLKQKGVLIEYNVNESICTPIKTARKSYAPSAKAKRIAQTPKSELKG